MLRRNSNTYVIVMRIACGGSLVSFSIVFISPTGSAVAEISLISGPAPRTLPAPWLHSGSQYKVVYDANLKKYAQFPVKHTN